MVQVESTELVVMREISGMVGGEYFSAIPHPLSDPFTLLKYDLEISGFGSQSMGHVCLDSFLDETFLVDRQTTIRQYLQDNPQVLETRPPPELEQRYSG